MAPAASGFQSGGRPEDPRGPLQEVEELRGSTRVVEALGGEEVPALRRSVLDSCGPPAEGGVESAADARRDEAPRGGIARVALGRQPTQGDGHAAAEAEGGPLAADAGHPWGAAPPL